MLENILYKVILTFLSFDTHHLEYHKGLYLDMFYLNVVLQISHVASRCQCLQYVDDTTIPQSILAVKKNLKKKKESQSDRTNKILK